MRMLRFGGPFAVLGKVLRTNILWCPLFEMGFKYEEEFWLI
jgi:hypothetical protein